MKVITVREISQKIKESEGITLLCHTNPDEDTVCSAYALYLAAQSIGKQARLLCDTKPPRRADHIIDTAVFECHPTDDQSLIISVDVAAPALLGELSAYYADRVDISIDHHKACSPFAKYTLCDPQAAATAIPVYEIIRELLTPTRDIAHALYAALSSDTGGFRHSNTDARAHAVAAELISLGADPYAVSQQLFDIKTAASVRAMRLALDSLRYVFSGKVAIITVSNEEKRREGLNDADLDELSYLTVMTEGVVLGAVLREFDKQNGRFKVSMRSRDPIDSSRVCARLGGGGHKNAAGATIVAKNIKEAEEILVSAIIPGLAQ